MKSPIALALAVALLASTPHAFARTGVIANAAGSCPGANAEAEAGEAALLAGDTEASADQDKSAAPVRRGHGKSAINKGAKSKWRSLLPGTIR